MPQGDSRTKGISDRESNSQPNCEDHRDIGHTLLTQQRPKRWRSRRLPPFRVPNGFCSSTPPTPSRQGQKTGACSDQARNTCTDHRPRHGGFIDCPLHSRVGIRRTAAGCLGLPNVGAIPCGAEEATGAQFRATRLLYRNRPPRRRQHLHLHPYQPKARRRRTRPHSRCWTSKSDLGLRSGGTVLFTAVGALARDLDFIGNFPSCRSLRIVSTVSIAHWRQLFLQEFSTQRWCCPCIRGRSQVSAT